jgi:hypothetical protein
MNALARDTMLSRNDVGHPAGHVLAVLTVAGGFGLAAAFTDEPSLLVAGAVALSLLVSVSAIPVLGGFIWLLFGPMIIGVARGGAALPLRPNELLLFVIAAGIAFRCWWHFSSGERYLPRLQPLDMTMGLLLVTGSIAPLLLRYGRGLTVSTDDVLYGFVFWKYFVLYAVFRISIRTPEHVLLCLRLALLSGAVVAIVAILQVKQLFGVPELLYAYYDAPFEATVGVITDRGSSTVASSFGLADMMAMCLAITIAMLATRPRHPLVLYAAGLIFLAGCVAAGSFSGIIGLAVVVAAIGYVTRRLLTLVAVLVPVILVAGTAFWPIISVRLAGFDSSQGLPHSWIGRLANLENFFWPELLSNFNWVWGVRPAARVAAPEAWRNWVYIESGHTWLLWVGGIPLLLAFMAFIWVALRDLSPIARADRGPIGIAASGGFAAVAMIFVVTLFDPHLTVRGSADLLFPLLALALVSRTTRLEESGASHSAPRYASEPSRGG